MMRPAVDARGPVRCALCGRGRPAGPAAGHTAPVGLLVVRCVPSAAGATRCCGGRAGGTLAAFLYSPIMVRPARLPGLPGVASGGRGCRGIRRPCWRCRPKTVACGAAAGIGGMTRLPCSGRGWREECGKRAGRCRVQARNPVLFRRYGRCRCGSGWPSSAGRSRQVDQLLQGSILVSPFETRTWKLLRSSNCRSGSSLSQAIRRSTKRAPRLWGVFSGIS